MKLAVCILTGGAIVFGLAATQQQEDQPRIQFQTLASNAMTLKGQKIELPERDLLGRDIPKGSWTGVVEVVGACSWEPLGHEVSAKFSRTTVYVLPNRAALKYVQKPAKGVFLVAGDEVPISRVWTRSSPFRFHVGKNKIVDNVRMGLN